MTNERDDMRDGAIEIASLLEKNRVRFVWVDPDIIGFEFWTVDAIFAEYAEWRDSCWELCERMRRESYEADGKEYKPTRWDPNDKLDECRRAAWAMNEMGMHFWLQHSDEEYAGWARAVREFQRELRSALVHFVHAMGGKDTERVREYVAMYCRELHTHEYVFVERGRMVRADRVGEWAMDRALMCPKGEA